MAKKNKISKVPVENVSDEGSLKLSDVSRLTLLRLQAEMKAEDIQIKYTTMNLNNYMQQVDPKGLIRQLEARIAQSGEMVNKFKTEYDECIKNIEEKLKICMKNYSFDDESGILHEHIDDNKQVNK